MLPQFFGGFPSFHPGAARFGRFNTGTDRKVLGRKGTGMSQLRTIVVDLLVILFITLCMGLASAVEARAGMHEQLAPMMPR
jgi:hypothetical protein